MIVLFAAFVGIIFSHWLWKCAKSQSWQFQKRGWYSSNNHAAELSSTQLQTNKVVCLCFFFTSTHYKTLPLWLQDACTIFFVHESVLPVTKKEGKGRGKRIHPRAHGRSVLPLHLNKKYSACIVTSQWYGFVVGQSKKA